MQTHLLTVGESMAFSVYEEVVFGLTKNMRIIRTGLRGSNDKLTFLELVDVRPDQI
jgi:hypothetical protein